MNGSEARIRLVVLAVEPNDRIAGDPTPETVAATFIRQGLFAVALPRVGDRIDAESMGENVAAYFDMSPTVVAVEHRLSDGRNADPVAYVLVRLNVTGVSEALIADFETDGYRVRQRRDPEERGLATL